MYALESVKHGLYSVFAMIVDNKGNPFEIEFKNIQESLDYVNALNLFVKE